MSYSQFTQDEENLLPNAFDALSEHFLSRDSFMVQYNHISELSLKLRFLRMASIYRALIKKGSFIPPSDSLQTSFNYYDITYKFVALISIIEALYSPNEWVDFYQWLSKSSNTQLFPIVNQDALEQLYTKYNSKYGAVKNAIKFFEALELPEQEFLKSKLTRLILDRKNLKASEIESTILELARLLYNVRSEFLHKARLIIEFGDIPAITANHKGKSIISDLSLDSLMRIFELGLLRHFGLKPDRNIFLF